jgi:hypothetical protein
LVQSLRMLKKPLLSEKPSLTVAIGMILVILALIITGLVHTSPPAPLSVSVSPAVFSSARAMSTVRQIAQKPHPIGTSGNAKVRNYLVAELKALGLEPHIQTALGINNPDKWGSVGVIHNVLVRVPGRVQGKALLLAAHYDSTHTGPGAADDGASVAAILETLRALKTLPALQNDLICLFTDGEEVGLLGAEAFVAEHSWAKKIGMVLNFEYRGNKGPFLMFETSPGNSKLIDGFAKAAAHPLGNSLMYEVYKRMPNDTDMTVFKRAGIPGMNFAAIEGHTSYHTQLDRPELLQEDSLQHQGDILLALTRHFGNMPLDDLRSADSVYFDAPGLGLVNYPVSWVLPLCGALILLFAAVLVLGLKSGELRGVRTALGALAFLIMIPLLTGTSQLLWLGIRQLYPEYDLMQGDTYNSHWYLLAFVMLTIGLFSLMQSGMRRWMGSVELALGAMACWLACLIAASIGLPGASFLLFWPLLPMLLTFGILFWQRMTDISSLRYLGLMLFGVAPGILMFTPLIKALFVGLTPQLIGVVMIFLVMLLGLLAPLIDVLTRRLLLPRLSLATGLLFLVTGSLTSGFDTNHPRPDNLFYAVNGSTGKAFWLSQDKSLDEWTGTFFPVNPERRPVPEIFGDESMNYWVARAPDFPVPAPTVEVLEDSTTTTIRKVNIQVRSLRHAPKLSLSVEGTGVISSKVEGRLFTQAVRRQWSLKGFGIPEEGLNIELKVQAGLPFKIRVIDFSYELPPASWRPRPSNRITQPFGLSDTTLVAKTIAFQ